MMMHPLLRLIASQPQLLIEHAEAYAELMSDELGKLVSGWTLQLMFNAAALFGLGASLILAGVALMLWAAIPVAAMPSPWLLLVTPLLMLLLTLGCALAGWTQRPASAGLDAVKRQVQADMAILHEVAAS